MTHSTEHTVYQDNTLLNSSFGLHLNSAFRPLEHSLQSLWEALDTIIPSLIMCVINTEYETASLTSAPEILSLSQYILESNLYTTVPNNFHATEVSPSKKKKKKSRYAKQKLLWVCFLNHLIKLVSSVYPIIHKCCNLSSLHLISGMHIT